MRETKRLICFAFFGCLIGSMIIFNNFALAAEKAGKVVEVRIQSQHPVGHHNTEAIVRFIAEAEKLSNKTLHFTHYPSQQLFTAQQIAEVLPARGLEMSVLDLYTLSATIPEGLIIDPSFVDTDWFMRWWYDTDNGGGLYYKILHPAFAKKNIYLLSTLNYGPTEGVITNKPVYKLADYKGMKLRCAAKNFGAFVESLGAKVVVISSGDVYMALQRGTIDGAVSGPPTISSRKWYEMGEYYQDLRTGNFAMGFGANMDFWKSLTPEQQTAIEGATRAAEIWCLDASYKFHNESMEKMKKGGVKIYDFPPDVYKGMLDKGIVAVKKMVEQEAGVSMWNEAMRLKENTRQGKLSALEILQKRKFIR